MAIIPVKLCFCVQDIDILKFQFQPLICIFLKWHQDAVSIRQTHFAMSAANLSRQERKCTLWKHLLKCVRPTRHISACLSGIKTNPGHLISRIRTFLHPSPRCLTALSFPYPLLRRERSRIQKRAISQRARKTLEIQTTI